MPPEFVIFCKRFTTRHSVMVYGNLLLLIPELSKLSLVVVGG